MDERNTRRATARRPAQQDRSAGGVRGGAVTLQGAPRPEGEPVAKRSGARRPAAARRAHGEGLQGARHLCAPKRTEAAQAAGRCWGRSRPPGSSSAADGNPTREQSDRCSPKGEKARNGMQAGRPAPPTLGCRPSDRPQAAQCGAFRAAQGVKRPQHKPFAQCVCHGARF